MALNSERIEIALSAIASRPRDIRAYLRQPGPDFEPASTDEIDAMLVLLVSEDVNHPARLRFSNILRSWDNADGGEWTGDTRRNSAERRQRIHSLMKSGS